MSDSTPSIHVHVDPANPGQFFACCGMLELADRLWPGAEGWFEEGVFNVNTDGSLVEILRMIVKNPAVEVTRLDNGLEVKALIAPLVLTIGSSPCARLTLDAWTRIVFEKGKPVVVANPPWNFWSGNQTSLRIWKALRDALVDQMTREESLLCGNDPFRCLLYLSGRFGFDPSSAWNRLDAGFSPNEQHMEVASSAVVEMLAAVGLQRFRPRMRSHGQSFLYSTWGIPLSPCVAAAAVSGAVKFRPFVRMVGSVVSRGSYSALGLSMQLKGADNE